MAERRMFSKGITNSAKFLKMPLESQALYFHLAQNADDDGIAEGFSIMRLVGASEDSLKILSAKKYIEILNDDLVIFVIDWLEHNSLRADRKKDSLYKELLLKKMPEVKLLQPKQRADRVKKVVPVTDNGQLMVGDGTSQGQTMDGRGEDRIGKGRLDNNKPFDFYNKNFGPITQFIAEDIGHFLDDGVSEELIIKSLEISLENNANNWKYAKAVLNNCISKNIKNLEQYKNTQNKAKKTVKNKPTKDDVEVGEYFWNPHTNMMVQKIAPIPRYD